MATCLSSGLGGQGGDEQRAVRRRRKAAPSVRTRTQRARVLGKREWSDADAGRPAGAVSQGRRTEGQPSGQRSPCRASAVSTWPPLRGSTCRWTGSGRWRWSRRRRGGGQAVPCLLQTPLRCRWWAGWGDPRGGTGVAAPHAVRRPPPQGALPAWAHPICGGVRPPVFFPLGRPRARLPTRRASRRGAPTGVSRFPLPSPAAGGFCRVSLVSRAGRFSPSFPFFFFSLSRQPLSLCPQRCPSAPPHGRPFFSSPHGL